jgi:hypothetical protein
MKKIIISISFCGLFCFGCKKNNEVDQHQLVSPITPNRVVNYDFELKYDSVLKAATYGLLDVMQNKQYRNIINTEISKQFDGDDNALFKEISVGFNLNGLDLIMLMEKSCNSNGYQGFSYLIPEVVSGFKYYHDTLYPQIFIPFYGSYDINASHSVCFNLEDDVLLPGFRITSGVISSANFNESYAQENPTYVVSINEIVDNSGNLPNNSNPSRRRTGSNLGLAINRIKISSKKENWGNGKAEVEDVFCLYKKSSCENIFSNYGFKQKVSSGNLNAWVYPQWRTEIFVEPNWWNSTDEAFIVLYEKDRRRKFEKQITVPLCNNIAMYYISKEGVFGTHTPSYSDYSIKQGATIDVSIGNNNFITLQSKWLD